MRLLHFVAAFLISCIAPFASLHAQCNVEAHVSGQFITCSQLGWHNTSIIDCPSYSHSVVKLKYGSGSVSVVDTTLFTFYGLGLNLDSVMFYDSIPTFVYTNVANPNCNLMALYVSTYDESWNLLSLSVAHRTLQPMVPPFVCFNNVVGASGCNTEDGSMSLNICNGNGSGFYNLGINIDGTWNYQTLNGNFLALYNLPQGTVHVTVMDLMTGCSSESSHTVPSTVDHLEIDVYGAENLNGIHDLFEPSLEGRTVNIAQLGLSGTSDANGTIAFYDLPAGNHLIWYDDVDGVYTQVPSSLSVGSVGCYALQLVPSDTLIFRNWISNSFQNGFVHCVNGLTPMFELQNQGTAVLNATLEFSFDPMFTVSAVNGATPFSTVAPGVVSWDILGQPMSSFENFSCHIEGPGIDHVLESFPFAWHLVVHDDLGNVVYDNSWSRDIMIVCGYDPNLLSATPAGVLDNHYILAGDTIEYHIDFQNTGSALAENIKVVDVLDPAVFNLNSIEVIGASHTFHSTQEMDGTLTFYFDHIQLPDSASDESASHGECSFKVRTRVDLGVNTLVHNEAAIYFDVNPAVLTNVYDHTIFDCWWLNGPPASYDVCSGFALSFENNNPYSTGQQWFVNDVLVSEESQFTFTPTAAGEYAVVLMPSNALCSGQQVTGVVVNANPDATLVANGNVLTAAGGLYYDWYLNGVLISGQNSESITATEDGVYSVDVYNIGCMSTVELVYTSISEVQNDSFGLSPNPASDNAIVKMPGMINDVLLYNSTGQLIMSWQKVASPFAVDTSSLPGGLYIVRARSNQVDHSMRMEVRK